MKLRNTSDLTNVDGYRLQAAGCPARQPPIRVALHAVLSGTQGPRGVSSGVDNSKWASALGPWASYPACVPWRFFLFYIF